MRKFLARGILLIVSSSVHQLWNRNTSQAWEDGQDVHKIWTLRTFCDPSLSNQIVSSDGQTDEKWHVVLIKPSDIHVGGLMFYHAFFLSSSSFRQLSAELDERYSIISGHMVGSKWNLKMHVWNVRYPFPLQIGGPKNHFRRFRNLRANLATYIFGMIHHIHKRASALQAMRALLYGLKTTRTLVHKRFQIGGEFSPTLRKFCIPLHCQALLMEISKRNSTTLCQNGRSC